MDAELFGGAALIAVGALQNVLDETLFEFADGLIKENPAIYHLSDKPFQLISHVRTLRCRKFF